jgi:hypothetical protein
VTKFVAVSAATRLQQKAEIDTFSKHGGGEVIDAGAGRARAGDVEPVAVELEEGEFGEVRAGDSDV